MTAQTHPNDGKRYIAAWAGLLALTLLSYGAHKVELGAFATVVSLGIAGLKALIVLGVFMHLTRESASIRWVAALNVAWVLLISFGIALDVATH